MEIYLAGSGAYIARNSFDYKDELKEAGFRYDGDSRCWITFSRRVALEMSEHLESKLLAKLQAEAAAENEEIAKSDLALPLLRPSGKLASQCVAEVSIDAATVWVKLSEKDDDFREIVKGASLRWADTGWTRTITKLMGSPTDRAADVARRLLEAGFVVRVRDAAAHAKAINGEFEDEQTMWVNTVASGEHAGWLHISWHYDDDMYDVASKLPGARYVPKGVVICPPDAVADVLDFAVVHGFSVTTSARAVLDAREAELARGVVVTLKPRKKKGAAKPVQGMPKLIPVVGEIDDDLRDND